MILEQLLNQSTQPIPPQPQSVTEPSEPEEQGQEFVPEYLLNDPQIVGYPDVEMQEYIYKWVSDCLPFDSYTLKDLGAGRGDFYKHLDDVGKAKYVDYHGIESNPNLVNVGRTKYDGINLINNNYFDFDLTTDYTILIGTLNEDNGEDKWERFKKTIEYCMKSTSTASILILASDMDGFDGFCDYPMDEVVKILGSGIRFNIDYSEFKDIYKLTVHNGGFD